MSDVIDQAALVKDHSHRPLSAPALERRNVQRYRVDIDGLRAVAVTCVVMFHAGLFPFSSGFVGVDIFFVISGYLIGGIILRGTKQGRFDFVSFYARRARRILPALILVLLITCFAGWFLLGPSELHDVGATATSALLAASNISFWRFQDYFAPDARLRPLLMTWSLGVEEQFYLFFPFLILGAIRLARGRVLTVIGVVTLTSFAFALWCTWAYPTAAFFLLPPRAWELGVGAMLAAWECGHGGRRARSEEFVRSRPVQEALGLTGLTLVAIAAFGFDESTPFPGFVALLPVIGAAALICAEYSMVNRHLLSIRPVVFVGAVSYSWYLWHWPIMSFIRIILPYAPSVGSMLSAAAAAFGIAVLSWRFVERPFRRVASDPGPTLMRYAFALAIALAAPLTIKLAKSLPQRFPLEATRVEAILAAGRGESCLADWDESKPIVSSMCVAAIPHRPTVALIGDSHAGALGAGLRVLAAQENFGFEIFAKSACLPLLHVTAWNKDHPVLTPTCAAFTSNALELVTSNPEVETVVLAGRWFGSLKAFQLVNDPDGEATIDGLEILRSGLERTIRTLTRSGKTVVLMGDTPFWRFDPGRLALTNSIPLRRKMLTWLCADCTSTYQGPVPLDLVYVPKPQEQEVLRGFVSTADRVRYVDLFSTFCSDKGCIYAQEGDPLFFDQHHLSIKGARLVLQGMNLFPDKN